MNESSYEIASQIFNALGHPTRLALMEKIGSNPARVQDLADSLGIPQPAVSQHLRILRAAALVKPHRNGREIIYHVRDEHVSHIVRDALYHANEDNEEEME